MYQGYYINLERNVERRERFLASLNKTDVPGRYERFTGVDGPAAAATHPTKLDPGNLGCWLSHLAILRRMLDSAGPSRVPEKHLHMVEDDCVLAPEIGRMLDTTLAIADEKDPSWDLIFTEVFMTPELRVFLRFAKAMAEYRKAGSSALLPLKASGFAGTSSYLVNRRSMEKYLKVMDGNWSRGVAIDIFVRAAIDQNHLKAYCIVPFPTTVSVDADASDIRGPANRSRAVFDNLRRSFYVHADHAAQLAWLKQVIDAGAPADPLKKVFLETVRFILSDDFEMF
jgi:GR25 family glycosyltransferase involved in LPS biosynthesis